MSLEISAAQYIKHNAGITDEEAKEAFVNAAKDALANTSNFSLPAKTAEDAEVAVEIDDECADGVDDGKISAGEALEAAGKGAKNAIKDSIEAITGTKEDDGKIGVIGALKSFFGGMAKSIKNAFTKS